jgi:large-conductance mechanosensitive channel
VCWVSGQQGCAIGSSCSLNGTCVSGLLSDGATCSRSLQCASQICVNNTCCDSECTGSCKSCNTGQCKNITIGTCAQCDETPPVAFPGAIYTCVEGTWKVEGRLAINSTVLVINVTRVNNTISATGCVNISAESELVIIIDPALVEAIVSGKSNLTDRILSIESEAGCLGGRFKQVKFTCGDQITGCISPCINAQQETQGSRSLSIIFSFGCDKNIIAGDEAPWWGILIGVVVAVSVIAFVAFILIKYVPAIRKKVFPYDPKVFKKEVLPIVDEE